MNDLLTVRFVAIVKWARTFASGKCICDLNNKQCGACALMEEIDSALMVLEKYNKSAGTQPRRIESLLKANTMLHAELSALGGRLAVVLDSVSKIQCRFCHVSIVNTAGGFSGGEDCHELRKAIES